MTSKLYVWCEKARNIPSKAGVYGFYDKNYELIYVGESQNLKESFEEYLKTKFSQDPGKQMTKYYKREFTLEPQKRKKEILEEYKKKYGRYPKYNKMVREEQTMIVEKRVSPVEGFHFYEDVGKPTDKVATSLEDFTIGLEEIPINSIEFHQKRGDFAKWIRNIIGATTIADAVERIETSGEDLRRELIETISNLEKTNMAICPECEVPVPPAKTWSMTGKLFKTGIRSKLTLGYYRCPKCGKAFRKVLAKEKIKG